MDDQLRWELCNHLMANSILSERLMSMFDKMLDGKIPCRDEIEAMKDDVLAMSIEASSIAVHVEEIVFD